MRVQPNIRVVRAWCAAMELAARYFRYTVEGFEHLRTPGPKLIVGYHGRPIAWDIVILSARIYRELGHVPAAVAHKTLFQLPVARQLFEGLGAIADDQGELGRALAEGRHVIVTPGGELELSRSFRDRYRVCWRHRRGYLRKAIAHRVPIVPVGAYGVDDPYVQLVDGITLGRKLGLPREIPATIALGPLGLLPFSPPFPVRFHQVIGPPIDLGDLSLDDDVGLERAHDLVVSRVQANIDRARRFVKGWTTETLPTDGRAR